MIIKQYDNGSAEIIFTDNEKKIIKEKGKFTLEASSLKHFSNNLLKIVADFHQKFDKKTKQLQSFEGDDIETS
jgi:hypothetical protein|tara:strand:- start:2007 stop:2225 length:219 start_codon:yes stop_codon:yes gene_type:complete